MTHLNIIQPKTPSLSDNQPKLSDNQPKLSDNQHQSSQMSNDQWATAHKQGYRQVGNHSAVKICEWTRHMLRGNGGCYKYIFYGIRSHQCLQMTTSMFCASRCKFCWRGQKAPVSKEWYGEIDEPTPIINKSITAQLSLLEGFKGRGYEKANQKNISEMNNIRHVALSLTGEPITYPKLNEILGEFHKRRISTFLVTNAQYPEELKKIKNCTQLYLSIDAPNKELMKQIDRPLFPDFWERTLKSLDILKTRNYRTCIRLSLIKNENMIDLEGYANLITRGSPDVIELKSYVWVGASQNYYKPENMPFMDDVRTFAKNLANILPEYEISKEHIPSRVILLIKKSLNKKRWINFPKFFDLVNSKKKFTAEDYSSNVMESNE